MSDPDSQIVILCIGCGAAIKVVPASWHKVLDDDGFFLRKYVQPVCPKCGRWWMDNIILNDPNDKPKGE